MHKDGPCTRHVVFHYCNIILSILSIILSHVASKECVTAWEIRGVTIGFSETECKLWFHSRRSGGMLPQNLKFLI